METMIRLWLLASLSVRERIDRSERGAAMVESALLVALIAAVVITVVGLLGGQVSAKFQSACSALKGGAC